MRELIIQEIFDLNLKHNKFSQDDLNFINEHYSDTRLLDIYETLVRYDADLEFKQYITDHMKY
jgi:hypothetical protein